MRIPRIYQPLSLEVGASVTLDAQAAGHVVRVLRLKAGDPVIVFNGEGGEYAGEITEVGKRHVVILLNDRWTPDNESPLRITLIQGVSRGERMDYTLQKAVELGVNEIYPVFSEHGAVHINEERKEKKQQHWQGVIHSACEQSGRNVVPSLHASGSLYDSLNQIDLDGYDLRLLLNHRATQSLPDLNPENPRRIALVAGPEGGLSETEISELERRRFVGIRLGPRVLRTETAALAAISVVQSLWGDFS